MPPQGAAADLRGFPGAWAAVKYITKLGPTDAGLITAHAKYEMTWERSSSGGASLATEGDVGALCGGRRVGGGRKGRGAACVTAQSMLGVSKMRPQGSCRPERHRAR